jgi:hypothetical protein
MEFPHFSHFAVHVEKQTPSYITKATFPLRYGKYSEIRTSEYEFIFNLNGEIKFIRGLNTDWPHPAEQLKRTDGNDWVYYSVGDVSGEKGIISWLGEYYLPCLPYPSNSIWDINYSSTPGVMNAFAAWAQLFGSLHGTAKDRLFAKARQLVELILLNHDGVLHERSQSLNAIIGGRVSVLPPDTRHVDYEIIPLMISDGCLYHCRFCCIKSAQNFQARSRTDILEQIGRLKDFYGRNIENYNGLFLGNHDALGVGEELICASASAAYDSFGFGRHRGPSPYLFLFGSVHSLLKAKHSLLDKLSQLPFYTIINIGLESIDTATLAYLGKPVDGTQVNDAFKKMLDINSSYKNIEITGNFVVGNDLSAEHYRSLKELLRTAPATSHGKGVIYLSPLKDSLKRRELLPLVNDIKHQSTIPVYVYLIQRL